MKRHNETRTFWKSVPPRGVALFLGGVACSFALLGFMVDVIHGARLSGAQLAATVAISALTAVLFAFSFIRHLGWLVAAVALQLGFIAFTRNAGSSAPTPEAIGARLELDAGGAIACMSLGYAFFVAFIATEGRKRLGYQAEIALAREIHQALVPRLELEHDAWRLHGESRPATEVGGDLVDALPTRSGLLAYVADVSGHGIPAGILMGMLKSATRMRLLAESGPDVLLEALNTVLFQVKRPNMFATAACVVLEQGRLSYALAGHPAILHYRSASRSVERLAHRGMALGILRNTTYSARSVVVAPGDVLAVITDGLIEVMDRQDRELGLEAIEAELAAGAADTLPALLERIVARAHRHGPQEDDQTLLLVRVT